MKVFTICIVDSQGLYEGLQMGLNTTPQRRIVEIELTDQQSGMIKTLNGECIEWIQVDTEV